MEKSVKSLNLCKPWFRKHIAAILQSHKSRFRNQKITTFNILTNFAAEKFVHVYKISPGIPLVAAACLIPVDGVYNDVTINSRCTIPYPKIYGHFGSRDKQYLRT